MVVTYLDDNNREFLQRRWRTAKKQKVEIGKKNIFARASRFFVQFLAVVARCDMKFHAPALWSWWAQQKNFVFLFLNLHTVLSDLTQTISPSFDK